MDAMRGLVASPCRREREGEGFIQLGCMSQAQPLTFVLSPWTRGEARETPH